MKTCTLRLIDAHAGSFDLLVVVLQILLVITTNGASLLTALASSATCRILELFGIDIGGT